MAIADDSLQYTQSLLFSLLVSFLLAKLFSFVFSPHHDPTSSPTNPPNINNTIHIINNNKPDEAEKSVRSDHDTESDGDGDEEDEDDWEGVETTELDEAFCAATAFVEADGRKAVMSKSLKLELYGLYKIATLGACCGPQPSAIMINARAKWNAWHKLGAMSPEEAMQKYIEIITETFPKWSDGLTSKRRGGGNNETSTQDDRTMGPDFSSFMHSEESGNEFKLDATHDTAREGDADKLLKCTEDSEDQTPSHGNVDCVHNDVAETQSSGNADINAKGDEGQTPLHHATACERDETGVLLVKKNNGTEDDDGDYPSDLSHSNWHPIQPTVN